MSEGNAALFWQVDPDPASSTQSGNMDSAFVEFHETALTADNIVPEEVTSIESVSTSKLDYFRRADACTALVNESHDTKPVEPVHAVCDRDRTGASAENTFTTRPL